MEIKLLGMKVLDDIKEHEGFKPKPYMDPLAEDRIPKEDFEIIKKYWGVLVPTFGYGFTHITKSEANDILIGRLLNISKQLSNKLTFYDELPQNIKGVLVEMAYQLGLTGLLRFKKMLRAIEYRNLKKAIEELKDSHYYKQTPGRVNDLIERLKNGSS